MQSSFSRHEQVYEQHPFLIPFTELSACLETDIETGLTPKRAEERLEMLGENRLSGDDGVKWYEVFAKQISNAMILVSTNLTLHIVRALTSM